MKTIVHLFAVCLFAGLLFISCKKEENPEQNGTGTEEKHFIRVIREYALTAEEMKQSAQEMVGDKANLSILKIPWHAIKVTIISYRTTDALGNAVEASGVITRRTDWEGDFRGLYSVQHGTCDYDISPSKLAFSPEAVPCLKGYIAVEADYLGYGISETADHFHPYLHAESTAQACYDMLLATKEYLETQHIAYRDTTHLIGYSQGGGASIALLKKLEEQQYPQIGKVYAGGSPLSIALTFNSLLKDSSRYSNYNQAAYSLMIMRSMDRCHQLQIDWSRIFKPDYAQAMDLLDSNLSFAEINAVLGKDMRKILSEDFFSENPAAINPEIAKLYRAFSQNDLIETFHPQHKVVLYHEPKDEIVPYENSKMAAEKHANYMLKALTSTVHFAGAIEFLLLFLNDKL